MTQNLTDAECTEREASERRRLRDRLEMRYGSLYPLPPHVVKQIHDVLDAAQIDTGI